MVTVGFGAKDSAWIARLGLRAVSCIGQAVDSLNSWEIRGALARCSKGGPDASWEPKKGKIMGYVNRTFGPHFMTGAQDEDLGTSNTNTVSKVFAPQDQAQRYDSDVNIHCPKRMSSNLTSFNTTNPSLFTADMKGTLPDPT